MRWFLETLLGLAFAGLTVASAYEAWQNRRRVAAGLLHGGIAAVVSFVALFLISTWPWRLFERIVNWLVTWLIPHLLQWLFDIVEFLICTVMIEIVTWLWDLLVAFVTCWYALPLTIVVVFGAVYLRFTQERDRQRLQNIAATGEPGEFDWGEALGNIFAPLLNILKTVL